MESLQRILVNKTLVSIKNTNQTALTKNPYSYHDSYLTSYRQIEIALAFVYQTKSLWSRRGLTYSRLACCNTCNNRLGISINAEDSNDTMPTLLIT